MNDLNRRLQQAFLFSNADLRANRAGRLTERQLARLRGARSTQRLALAVFGVVMVGSVAIVVVATLVSAAGGNPNQYLPALATIAAVVGAVILFGLISSRRYMTQAQPRQMLMAQGPAIYGRIKPDAADFQLQIGAAKLRLTIEEHLLAFTPGVEYRVFYLPGAIATILSAEVIGTEAESDAAQDELPVEQDEVVRRQRSALPILVMLGVLALGIPLAGMAASLLPGGLRWVVMALLLVIAVGFAYWALRRLDR